jgi:hypothetical protein
MIGETGGARRISPPGPLIDQPACKPGSVGRGQAPRVTAIPLGRRLPGVSSNLPGQLDPDIDPGTSRLPRRPYSVLLPVGFTVPFPSPETRCALTAPFHPYRPAAYLCARSARAGGLFSVALSLGLPPPDLIRHRMSMEPGLSSPAAFRRAPGRPSGRLMITSWAPLTVGSSPSPSVVAFARGPRSNGRPPRQIAGPR